MPSPPALHVLTIDLEDWFHPLEPDPGRWDGYARRAEVGTHLLLDLLCEYGASATFFVLGDVARHSPELVREIATAGHEIGTHGTAHQVIQHQKPDEFRRDLQDSIRLLESATGNRVRSYRAPIFSVNSATLWALEIIKEEGILHDSSIFPMVKLRYGMPHARRTPHEIIRGLWEWPPATVPTPLGNLPIAGGIYLRILPERFIRYGIQVLEQRKEPVVLYLHPWELDPEQPRPYVKSRFLRFRHYSGLKRTAGRVARILRRARYTSIAAAADLLAGPPRCSAATRSSVPQLPPSHACPATRTEDRTARNEAGRAESW